jgi:hypothetical protein
MRHVSTIMLGAVLLAGSLAAGAQGNVLYREVFGNNTDANQPISYAGWNLYYDTVCSVYSSGSPGSWDVRVNYGAGEDAGKPTNLPAVNSNPASAEMEQGWCYMRQDDVIGPNWLAWTSEVAGLGIDKSDLSEVSWYQSDNFDANYRLALKIDSNWYFSGTTYSNSAGFPLSANGVKNAVSDFSSASWYNAYVNPGAILDRDTNPSQLRTLPNGVVQAVGLYAAEAPQLQGMRFDTFEIQGIPEPGTCVMLLMSCLGLVIWGGRSRER